jgi:hypothetical protein
MERYTEYTIAHDGVPVEKLPPMRDHDTAVRRLKVDRSIYPDKEVTLIHRSVTCGDWALTTAV